MMMAYQHKLAKRMWAEGASAKQIAYAVRCTPQYVYVMAMNDRESFPRRYRRRADVDVESRAALVERIRSGELSVRAASKECGASQGTVSKWVREAADVA